MKKAYKRSSSYTSRLTNAGFLRLFVPMLMLLVGIAGSTARAGDKPAAGVTRSQKTVLVKKILPQRDRVSTGLHVAILATWTGDFANETNSCVDIANLLNENGMNAEVVRSTAIDSLPELLNYDVVIIGSTGLASDDDASGYGDVQSQIRSFVEDHGRGVVAAGWILYSIGQQGYADYAAILPMSLGYYTDDYPFTLSVTDLVHPVMSGVSGFSLDTYGESSDGGLKSGAEQLAAYGSGNTAVAAWSTGTAKGRVVYLGPIYMATERRYSNSLLFSNADAKKLLVNAVLWAGNGTPVNPEDAQCIFHGTLRIDGEVPSVQNGVPTVELLRRDLSYIRTANYNPENSAYGVSAFRHDGLNDGDQVAFRVIYNGDSIIAKPRGDRSIFIGAQAPNPPNGGSLRMIDLSNNHPPAFTSTPGDAAKEDSLYQYLAMASDPDDDVLSYGLAVAPVWLHMDSVTGVCTGIPRRSDVGDTSITIVASDGYFKGAVYQTFALHVSYTNHAPTVFRLLTPANNDSTIKSKTILFAWHPSSDVDVEDALTYSLHVSGPGVDTVISGVKDTVVEATIPSLEPFSVYEWYVSVTDGIVTVFSSAEFTFGTQVIVGVRDRQGKSEIPAEFALQQNYPNPFNPVTVIAYELPVNSHVKLSVYNVIGYLVATLKNGVENAGYKSVEFNGSALPSGMYFYKIEATSTSAPGKSFSVVRKLVLLK